MPIRRFILAVFMPVLVAIATNALGQTSVEAHSRELTLLNGELGVGKIDLSESVSRELSVFNGATGIASATLTEAHSRECSLLNGPPTFQLSITDVASRELSVFNGSQVVPPLNWAEASSREWSVLNGTTEWTQPVFSLAASREVSVYNGTVPISPRVVVDTASRELSVYNDLDGLIAHVEFADAFSRELSVYRPSPDARVTSITVPVGAQTDNPMTVAWTVRNDGDAALVGPWTDRVRLSVDPLPDAGDVVLGTSTAPISAAVQPGAELSRSATVQAPPSPGTYYLIVDTDSNSSVSEFESGEPAEQDNTFVSLVSLNVGQAPRPDLIVTSITPPPGNVLPGQIVSVAWTIKNIGNAAAVGTWTEQLYGSADPVVGGDIAGPAFRYTSIVPVGGELLRVQNYTVPSVPPGGYWLVVCLDTTNALLELDNQNNCGIEPVCVNCQTANLVVQAPITVTSPVGPNSPLAVFWTVTNTGSGSATGTWIDRVYLSTDDVLGNDVLLGSSERPGPLPPGGAYGGSGLYPIGFEVAPGAYHVFVQTDATNVVLEPGAEGDNFVSSPVTVTHPPTADLVVADITGPTSGEILTSVSLQWTLKNQGSVAASGTWQERVLLSSDSIVGNDQLVSIPTFSGTIEPGAEVNRSTTITLPPIVGPKWVVVTTDFNDAVEEGASEGNNSAISAVPVQVDLPPSPDLTVQSITVPSNAPVGELVDVSWTVVNHGAVPTSGSWSERIYASPDSLIGGDVLLATFAFNDVISPGASILHTKQIPVPSIPGGYRIVACVDVGNAILEPDESDNCLLSADTSLPLLPDLVASSIATGPVGIAGQKLAVSWIVTNQSQAAAAGGWVDTVYLSPDANPGGDDVIIGSFVRQGGLAGGSAYVAEAEFQLGEGLAGQYIAYVRTDTFESIPEADESSNNLVVGPVPVMIDQPPRPNLRVTTIDAVPTGLIGAPLTIAYQIENAGKAGAVGSWNDRVSLIHVATGTTVVVPDQFIQGPLAVGGTYKRSIYATYPALEGAWRVQVVVDQSNAVPEGVLGGEDDNTALGDQTFDVGTYVVTVSTPVTKQPGGSAIPLAGFASLPGGASLANVPVAIAVDVQGTTRVVQATTDEGGAFSATFQPLANEGGAYALHAGPPGAVSATIQDTFVLHNFVLLPNSAAAIVFPKRAATIVPLTVRNTGDVPLTSLAIQAESLPAGVELTAVPASTTIGPRQDVAVELQFSASGAEFGTSDVVIHAMTAEGVERSFTVALDVRPPQAQLAISPSLLKGAMLRAPSVSEPVQTLVEFTVTNIGATLAPAVEVELPNVPWMALATPATLPDLDAGESATVLLVLTPPSDLQLGTYSGTIVLEGDNTYLSLPYEFANVSDRKGQLRIEVTDEVSYWCAATPDCPRVSGAIVEVRETYRGRLVASTVTDASGVVYFPDLPEGYYKVDVSAAGHTSFQGTVFVPGDAEYRLEAFISQQLVTYEWSVVPTTILDQYLIQITAGFVAYVPAPVVTIEPGYIDLAQMMGESMTVDLRIRNYGLIAAQDAKLVVGSHPRYQITPLLTDLGDIPGTFQGQPPTELIVPCIIVDTEFGSDGGTAGSDCVGVDFRLAWTLICNIPVPYYAAVTFGIPGADCPPWSPAGCSGCGGGGGGGGGAPPTASGPSTVVQPLPCGACDPSKPPEEQGEDVLCKEFDLSELADLATEFLEKVTLGKFDVDLELELKPCVQTCCSPDGTTGFRLSVTADATATLTLPTPSISFEGEIPELPLGNGMTFEGSASAMAGFDVPITVAASFMAFSECNSLFGWTYLIDLTATIDPSAGIQNGTVSGTVSLPNGESYTATGTLQGFAGTGLSGSAHYSSTSDQWTGSMCFKGIFAQGEASIEVTGQDPIGVPCVRLYAVCPRGWKTNCACKPPEDCGVTPVAQGGCDFGSNCDTKEGGVAGDDVDPELQAALDAISAQFGSDLVNISAVMQPLLGETEPPLAGTCAKVVIAIDQQFVLARSAFKADLVLNNDGSDAPIESISASILVRDGAGNDQSALFAIGEPTVVGMGNVTGSGALPPGPDSSGSASWVIVPTDLAAPSVSNVYWVSGTLQYARAGFVTTIPLFPVPITVFPNPSLKLDYFLETRVYSDDPNTQTIEPSVPFALALMVANQGAGTAFDAAISSGQPYIVENENGLVIDFDIVSSQLDKEPLTPSLTTHFGDISPNERHVVQWMMTSTLEGKFIDFDATVTNLNGFNSPELSLIDGPIGKWPLLHVVRALYPADDQKPDFLVRCPPDAGPEGCIFDPPLAVRSLHSSTGEVLPVEPTTDGIAVQNDPPNLSSIIQAPMSAGWNYLRVDDPYAASLKLVDVRRSDGSQVLVGPNAWQTSRIVYPLVGDPYPERWLHILDHSALGPGDGAYILQFAPDVSLPSISEWVVVNDHGSLGPVGLSVANSPVVALSEPRVGGISRLDVVFSEPIDPSTFAPTSILVEGRLGPDNTPYYYNGRISTSLLNAETRGVILFDPPLPEFARYCVRVAGVKDVSGNPLGSSSKLKLASVAGDSYQDLRVNVADLSAIGAFLGTNPIDPTQLAMVRADINRDGGVGFDDILVALGLNGTDARFLTEPCDPAAQSGDDSGLDPIAEIIGNAADEALPPSALGSVDGGSGGPWDAQSFDAMFVPPTGLSVGVLQVGDSRSTDGSQALRLDVPPGATVKIVAHATQPGAWTSLLVGFDRVPTWALADSISAVPASASQEVLIPSTDDRAIYVVASAGVPTEQGMVSIPATVTVERVARGLNAIEPASVGAGHVTLLARGGELATGDAITLRDAQGTVWSPTSVDLTDAANVRTTFDLSGAPIGEQLYVMWNGEPTAVRVRVESPLSLAPSYELEAHSAVATRVLVRNEGNVDGNAHELVVNGTVVSVPQLAPGQSFRSPPVVLGQSEPREIALSAASSQLGRRWEASQPAPTDGLSRLGLHWPANPLGPVVRGPNAGIELGSEMLGVTAPTSLRLSSEGNGTRRRVVLVGMLDSACSIDASEFDRFEIAGDVVDLPANRFHVSGVWTADQASGLDVRYDFRVLPSSRLLVAEWRLVDRSTGREPELGSRADRAVDRYRPLDRLAVVASCRARPGSNTIPAGLSTIRVAVAGESGVLDSIAMETPIDTRPSGMQAIASAAASSTSATVDLLADEGTVGIRLYVSVDDGPAREWGVVPAVNALNVRLAISTEPGHRYFCRAVAIDAAGNEGQAIAGPTFRTLGLWPSAPLKIGHTFPTFRGAASPGATVQVALVGSNDKVVATESIVATAGGDLAWTPVGVALEPSYRVTIQEGATLQERAVGAITE